MEITATTAHEIELNLAAEMTKRYRDQMPPEGRKGGFFGAEAIQQLLDQEGCIGIRYYYAIDSNGSPTIVLVGVDAHGNDQIGDQGACMDMAIPCPGICSDPNALNQ